KDIKFIPDYYSSDYLNKKPGLIVLRHILEHIVDPKDFLTSIICNQKLYPSDIYVEVPDWEWIVDNDQVMMFSNDHCSYYSKNSLELTLSLCGFKCEQLSTTFEDEYLQYFGKEISLSVSKQLNDTPESLKYNRDLHLKGYSGTDLTDKTKSFIRRIPKVLERFKSYFSRTSNDAVLWGAGGKGAILLSTLGISYKQLPFVVDSNPNKHNTYIPVTGQQVIPPDRLKIIRPRYVFITNPSYYKEIESQLNSLGIKARIIIIKNGGLKWLYQN
ncbi:unnamed protein product, partial [marine sediment metagenome]